MTVEELVEQFQVFRSGTGGLGQWIRADTSTRTLERLVDIDNDPLSLVQLNQLLALGHEAPMSGDFFRYYWLDQPRHFYPVSKVPGFPASDEWERIGNEKRIISTQHLYWGLYRYFVDSLLCFGNARSAYRALRGRTLQEMQAFFAQRRFGSGPTGSLLTRGPALPMHEIARDSRYLISEMACKSLEQDDTQTIGSLGNALMAAFRDHTRRGGGSIPVRDLFNGDYLKRERAKDHQSLLFSADELLDEHVASEEQLLEKYTRLYQQFEHARQAATRNTELYLSMVNELDAYVATSMRTREHFRRMAEFCDQVFGSSVLRELHLRYFDPTLSAAQGHEDKGLIECLMVKCAKVLIYTAGEKESFGKDAEASMALSLGKPVIFYCEDEGKSQFYRDVHPLGRLIHFETGVATGAMITSTVKDVVEILRRLFFNEMEYTLEQHPSRPGYLRLRENVSNSIVRLHTNDELLTETFWNHYNQRPQSSAIVAHF